MASVQPNNNEFGLLTPETTLNRANDLNNAYQCLWRAATGSQKEELIPVLDGFVAYYDKLRDSFFARFTEYGEIQKWEAEYGRLLKKFSEEQNTYIQCPAIMPGEAPFVIPKEIEIEAEGAIKEAEKKGEELTEDLKKTTRNMFIYSTLSAVLGGAIIWLFTRKKGGR